MGLRRIVIITNPNAKENAKDPERAERLAQILGDRGLVYQTRVPEEIDPVIERLKGLDMELLGICGGDGTYQRVLTALVNGWGGNPLPRVHLLKGGSMNTIRYSLGAKACAEDGLRLLMYKLNTGAAEVERRMLLRVNAEKYGFLFGFGAATRFLEEYYSSSMTGPMRAADTLYKCISSITTRSDFIRRITAPTKADATIDGEAVEQRDWTMVLAGTVEYIGLGFRTLGRARERDGHFALWASTLRPSRMLAQIHRIYQGKRLNGEGHIDTTARAVSILPEEGRIAYVLDGELYAAPAIELEAGPAIEIIKE